MKVKVLKFFVVKSQDLLKHKKIDLDIQHIAKEIFFYEFIFIIFI
jgi:hypothetical protein